MIIEKNKKEEILCLLDKGDCIFPGFEIVKQNNQPKLIGSGGFSSVYEMHCPERPEGKYALKVMGFENHVITSKNFRETVGLQGSLSEHTPYICRLINAKEVCILLDEDGNLTKVSDIVGERWVEDGIHLQFILMEQLEDLITKNRFGKVELMRSALESEEEVVELALQIGHVLYQAHIRNILHRDVKLENIFWDDEAGCYKLGDFGIAKETVAGSAETVVYTDGYGAPEIERHLYDYYKATADIYSFGITLYLLLNDFKFPGSDGYYANAVQYSEDFIFPAPAHASEGMTRIIRKMCQYYQEDRYQSMAEVLMDLSAFRDRCTKKEREEEIELPDFETETYREEKDNDKEQSTARRRTLTGREERKEYEKIENELYNESSILHFFGITFVLALIMRGMQGDTSIIGTWQFWIFPVLLLLETILLRVKEFHIVFGIITFAVGIYTGFTVGVSVPYVIMMLGLITGIPVVTFACVTATVIWGVLLTTDGLQWLDFIGRFDLSWVFIVILLFLLHHYILIRVDYEKTTYIKGLLGKYIFDKIYIVMAIVGIVLLILEKCDLIQVPQPLHQVHMVRTGLVTFVIMVIYMWRNGYLELDEEGYTDENEMDHGGDGEHPDTIE